MDQRTSLVKIITSPLGFFALSLLILEGFLTIVVVGSGDTIPWQVKELGMWMATLSFGGVVVVVSLMVWLIPKKLTFKSDDWRDESKDEIAWGTSQNPQKKKFLQDEPQEKPVQRNETQ